MAVSVPEGKFCRDSHGQLKAAAQSDVHHSHGLELVTWPHPISGGQKVQLGVNNTGAAMVPGM